tara:strand:+ start:1044 stop:1307 length:264 start_codon:yes stop_codon:yes gene_type:complete
MSNLHKPHNNLRHVHRKSFNQGAHSGSRSLRCAYVSSLSEQNPVIGYQQSEWEKTCKKYNEQNNWETKEEKHNQLKLLLLNINKNKK